MQHARYVTRRDRQINGNAVDIKKIQAEIESNVASFHSRLKFYSLSNSMVDYLLNCSQHFD